MTDSIKAIKWTPAQAEVKDARGLTMLVSASSGSGKTTVMINRIADLIAGGVNVDSLLVTTFTNAAAADMRLKLAEGLAKRVDTEQDNLKRKHILNSIEALDLADIGTLHSFCGDLIRQYYYAADYDPNFTIASESEVNIKKRRAAESVLLEYLSQSNEAGNLFGELHDIISRKRKHDRFFELVDRVYEYSRSLYNGAKWLESLGEDNGEVKEFLEWFYNFGKDYFLHKSKELADTAKSADYTNAEELATYILSVLEVGNLVEWLADGGKLEFPRLGIKKKLDSYQSQVNDEADKLRSEFRKFCGDIVDISIPENPQNREYARTLVAFVKDYGQRYEELKSEDYELDFGDLEQGALKILSDGDINSLIKEKYEYVFVDEYQDINPIQERIIELVAREDNLFMVGDVKQSIYRFRLCDPSIFIGKYKKFKSNDTLAGKQKAYDLNDNFRSTKPILDFNNKIFARIMTEKVGGVDYLRNAMLQGTKPFLGEGAAVKLNLIYRPEKQDVDLRLRPAEIYSVREHQDSAEVFDPAEAEADYIAGEIYRLIDSGVINDKGKPRKVDYSDIVILCRSMTAYTSRMASRLSRYYPVKTKGEGNVVATTSVTKLIDYLKIVDNSQRDIPLIGVLNNEFGGLNEGELAAIRLRYGYEEFFFSAAEKYANEMDDYIAGKLRILFANVDKHRRYAECHTAAQVLRRIIADFNYQTEVFKRADGEVEWSYVKDFVSAAEQGRFVCPVSEFVRYIDAGAMTVKGSSGSGTDNAIRFMSIHSSKGLEFPVVFLAGMGNRYNFDKDEVRIDYRLKLGFCNYDTQLRVFEDSGRKNAISCKAKFEAIEDEMRLLYVALTRASDYLMLSAVVADNYTPLSVEPYSLMEVRAPIDFVMAAMGTEARESYIESGYEITSTKVNQAPVIDAPNPIIPAAPEELVTMFRKLSVKPECESCGLASKYTVTELNDLVVQESQQEDSSLLTAVGYDGTGLGTWSASKQLMTMGDEDSFLSLKGGGTELGNAYHYIMYHIDKTTDTIEGVNSVIARLIDEGVLSQEQGTKIVPEKILRCLNSEVMQLVRDPANQCYAEKQFMMYLPASEVMAGAPNDKVLVQGVIDLMIVTPDGVIIADYKITKASPERLKIIYSNQLNLYSAAVEKILGLKVIGKWLYSFYTDSVIKL